MEHEAKMPQAWYNYDFVVDLVRDEAGIPDAYCGTGVRITDSIQRRCAMKKNGNVFDSNRRY